jgi:long-chain acyl-CoA synthetase
MQLEQFLEASARRLPGKTALVAAGRRLSYAEVDRLADRLAWELVARGISRGQRVLVQLENSAEAVAAIFGVLKAGAVLVMLNPMVKSTKLRAIAQDCGAAALVTEAARLPAARACLAGFGMPELVAIERALARDADDASPPKRSIDMDLAALIYTSGSTGRPKGVMLTHANMVAAATSITQYLDIREDEVILNVLPLSFDYGMYQVLMAFKAGATVVLERSFAYPAALLGLIAREKVTGLPIVPTLSAMLLQLDLSKFDLSSLRYITNTGAALPSSHIAGLRARLPGTRIFSMYGLTECKRVAYLPPEEIEARPGSVGKAMPNEEVWIVDERGRRLGPGAVGELVVRGANVMKGYWGMPEETDRVLRPGLFPWEKVLYTGDLFRADEAGYLYYVGRRDEMIKSRGEKVSPREVEEVLHALEGVAEAAVVGVPDRILGHAVKAVIVPRQGARLTAADVLRHCRSQLEDFMVPASVEFRAMLPKTDTGKVARSLLVGLPQEAAA